MSARFCSQCGASLREESRFCASCGASTNGSPASAPAAPAMSEFLVKSGFAKTRLVIAEGLLTVDVDAVPPALGHRFRRAWLLEVAALIVLAVVLSAAGAAEKGGVGSLILGLCIVAAAIGTPLIYWTVIRAKHQIFTVVTPLASIERLSVGTANTVIMVALWLCLGLPGLFYYIWTTRFPAVIVHAPFMLGPDRVGKLAFRCNSQAETSRLLDTLKRPPPGQPDPRADQQPSIAPALAPTTPAPTGCQVEFDADGRVVRIDVPEGRWALKVKGQNKYYEQRMSSLLEAAETLNRLDAIPQLTYYTVTTPAGSLGRDCQGFYTEAPLKTKNLTVGARGDRSKAVEFSSLKLAGDPLQNQTSVALLKKKGQYVRFVLLMKCGKCGYESPVETQAGSLVRECYCCGTENTGQRGTVSVVLGSGLVVEI
jgi:hypothetical protein